MPKIILSYCLNCRKDIVIKNPEYVKTKNGRLMLLPNVQCVIVKNQNLLEKKKKKDC